MTFFFDCIFRVTAKYIAIFPSHYLNTAVKKIIFIQAENVQSASTEIDRSRSDDQITGESMCIDYLGATYETITRIKPRIYLKDAKAKTHPTSNFWNVVAFSVFYLQNNLSKLFKSLRATQSSENEGTPFTPEFVTKPAVEFLLYLDHTELCIGIRRVAWKSAKRLCVFKINKTMPRSGGEHNVESDFKMLLSAPTTDPILPGSYSWSAYWWRCGTKVF